MKLSKYLAGYIHREKEIRGRATAWEELQEIIQQGIEAFESTEGVKVKIIDENIITDRCQDKEE